MLTGKAFRIFHFIFAPILFAAALFFFVMPARIPTIEAPPASAERFEHLESLQTETDALLPLFDEMPPVEVFLTAQPIFKSGSSIESGVAYTRCDSREKPLIFIKKDFYEKTNRKQLVNILKHELTHAWLCRQNIMSGHDENFRRKFKSVGGFGN